jgi:NADP-dependent 3-hydroxy acid dehydrogenase YdfG
MTELLKNKTALVTGVTSGIGLATARALIHHGAHLLGLGRDERKLTEVGNQLGSEFVPVLADLASADDRARVGTLLAARGDGLDILINNAAECVYKTPLELESAHLARLFEVNVVAAIELARIAVRHMVEGAHIVQLSSVTARHVPNAKFAPYAATKNAVEQLTQALRWELHPRGIAVTSIFPGLVETPIYDKVTGFEATHAKLKGQLPEWLSPEDVADAILWTLTRPLHVAVSEVALMPRRQPR